MQLILPQLELEQAIKNYVNDLMTIKEGMVMTIDLRAGRGIEGFTATVDITKQDAPVPPKTVVPASRPPALVMPVRPVTDPLVRPAPEPKEVVVPDPVVEPEEKDEPVDNKSEDSVVDSSEPEVVTAVAPPTVRRAIFGNNKKPE